MRQTNLTTRQDHHGPPVSGGKILLALLPFWNPLIPPMGISSLKVFLEKHGYEVKTRDANTDQVFKKVYDTYFSSLARYIPEDKQGNFFNVGHDVLYNHMMAHLNYTDPDEYAALVKVIVSRYFFCPLSDSQVDTLCKAVGEFYGVLEDYVLQMLSSEQPAVMGLSVYIGTLPSSLFAFKIAKAKYPGIITVMGGGIFSNQLALNSPNLEFFLTRTPYIDKIIIGEGEQLFLKFLHDELPRKQRVYTLEDIQGQMLDLSTVEAPDFSDFVMENYPYQAVSGSSGCPFQCKFCNSTAVWGKYRKKKPVQVVAEMMNLYEKYRNQLFFMTDQLLNPVIFELADEVSRAETALYYDGYFRIDEPSGHIDNTLLWRRGGFYRARIGAESGSQHVLDLMNKKITPQQIKTAVANLAEAGIKTTVYWVIGFPGETEADFLQTLDLVEELKDDIYEAEAAPFKYSYSGQHAHRQWLNIHKPVLLFPEKARDLLLIHTWILDAEPSREITFQRMWRFIRHCGRLGIPNPYSIYDIYQADERWKGLHPNAVPPLVEFQDKSRTVAEGKTVKKLSCVRTTFRVDDAFNF